MFLSTKQSGCGQTALSNPWLNILLVSFPLSVFPFTGKKACIKHRYIYPNQKKIHTCPAKKNKKTIYFFSQVPIKYLFTMLSEPKSPCKARKRRFQTDTAIHVFSIETNIFLWLYRFFPCNAFAIMLLYEELERVCFQY